MRTTLLFLLLTTTLSAQSWWGNRETVRGNGDVVTQERNLSDFDEISVCCAIEVVLRPDDSFGVRVEAESNVQDYILTERQGSTLNITVKNGTNLRDTKTVIVYVSMPTLEGVEASSSSRVSSTGTFRGDELEVDVSSSADVELSFEGEEVELEASSGSGIELRGTAKKVTADVSSGAKIIAEDLRAERARADASSGGRVEVYASKRIDADASSGGSVRYKGNPGEIDTDTSSGGSVRGN